MIKIKSVQISGSETGIEKTVGTVSKAQSLIRQWLISKGIESAKTKFTITWMDGKHITFDCDGSLISYMSNYKNIYLNKENPPKFYLYYKHIWEKKLKKFDYLFSVEREWL